MLDTQLSPLQRAVVLDGCWLGTCNSWLGWYHIMSLTMEIVDMSWSSCLWWVTTIFGTNPWSKTGLHAMETLRIISPLIASSIFCSSTFIRERTTWVTHQKAQSHVLITDSKNKKHSACFHVRCGLWKITEPQLTQKMKFHISQLYCIWTIINQWAIAHKWAPMEAVELPNGEIKLHMHLKVLKNSPWLLWGYLSQF